MADKYIRENKLKKVDNLLQKSLQQEVSKYKEMSKMLDQLGRDRFRQKREQIKKKEDEYVAFLNKYQQVGSTLTPGSHDVQ